MRFDDRLQTVLAQPASNRRDRSVRWRQLVDLVARAGGRAGGPTLDQALDIIRDDGGQVDEELRAAAARAIAALDLPVELIRIFAADRLSVSVPVLAAARLDGDEWRRLYAEADAETQNFIGSLHPEAVVPASPEPQAEPEPEPEAAAPAEVSAEPEPEPAPVSPEPAPEQPAADTPSISELLARIEQLRRARAAPTPTPEPAAEAIDSDEPAALFRWESTPGGDIAWVEGAPRGGLIGRSIARSDENQGGAVDEDVSRAFAMRAPFRDAALAIAGHSAVSGRWRISGIPAFEPADGRFAGYRGIALREPAKVASAAPATDDDPAVADPDQLRELVHELKTPLNAIVGFAEIIDGQFFGPADRRYRDRAGEIVGEAHVLLAAIDDLDLAARLQSEAAETPGTHDLHGLVAKVAARLSAAFPSLQVETIEAPGAVASRVPPELAERLFARLCLAAGRAAEGSEAITVAVTRNGKSWRFSVSAPSAGEADESGETRPQFTLRLVRGLARLAGGDLEINAERWVLLLPKA